MSESSPIKDALYAKINNIGQEEIHQLLLKEEFSELFEKIYEPVIHEIQSIEEYEKYGTLAESMTHYLFTEMLIPSQRKIIFENIELDIVIPNTLELQKNSNNAIIIFFVNFKCFYLTDTGTNVHKVIIPLNLLNYLIKIINFKKIFTLLLKIKKKKIK